MEQFTNAFYSLLKLCVVSVLVSRCSYPYGEVDAFHYRAPNNSNNNNRHKHNLCKQHQNIEKKMTTSLLPLHLFPSSSSADENTNNVPGRWAGGRAVDVVRTTAAAATLAILLTTTTTAAAATAATTTTSNSAAQVYLNQIPPTEISIEVSDLPIVGKLVSGRYAKVDDNKATTKNKRNDAASQPSSSPSIVIKSPKDTVKAITGIAKNGHIEVDLAGDVGLRTHLDVDVAADEAGVATVRIASDLIPPLPFKNLASSSSQSSSVTKGGGKQSQWNTVTNMGNGETYYFNTKTGATQYEKPGKI